MTSTRSLLLLLGLAVVVTGKLEVPKIQILKQQSEVLSEQNPKNGPACFSFYSPKLENISTQYEITLKNCNTRYEKNMAIEDKNWQAYRSKLEVNGENSCRAMFDCQSIVGYVEAFECFAQMGAEQSKSMYSLSAEATENAIEIQPYYRIIETEKAMCITQAERTYVENTITAYEQLNTCLNANNPTNPSTYYYTTTTSGAPSTTTTTRGTTRVPTTIYTGPPTYSTTRAPSTPTTTRTTTRVPTTFSTGPPIYSTTRAPSTLTTTRTTTRVPTTFSTGPPIYSTTRVPSTPTTTRTTTRAPTPFDRTATTTTYAPTPFDRTATTTTYAPTPFDRTATTTTYAPW